MGGKNQLKIVQVEERNSVLIQELVDVWESSVQATHLFLSPDEYEFGDELKVYVDNEQNVIQVTNVEEGLTVREMEVLVGLLGSILVPILLLLCVYMPIAYYTFGKPWREFCREFNRL